MQGALRLGTSLEIAHPDPLAIALSTSTSCLEEIILLRVHVPQHVQCGFDLPPTGFTSSSGNMASFSQPSFGGGEHDGMHVYVCIRLLAYLVPRQKSAGELIVAIFLADLVFHAGAFANLQILHEPGA